MGSWAWEEPAQLGPGKTLPVWLPLLGHDEAGRQEVSPEWGLRAAQARANPLEKGPRVVPGGWAQTPLAGGGPPLNNVFVLLDFLGFWVLISS